MFLGSQRASGVMTVPASPRMAQVQIRAMFCLQRMTPPMQRAERHLTSRALSRRGSFAQLTALLSKSGGAMQAAFDWRPLGSIPRSSSPELGHCLQPDLYRYSGPSSTPIRPKTTETKQWDLTTTDALGRTISASSTSATSPGPRAAGHPMDATRGSISSASTAQSARDDATASSEPFILRHGRRYLRSVPHYPLPCDLPELQRQNLQTLLATSIFDRALGHTPSLQNPPKKVLELACGSGYYSAVCHDFLCGLGYDDVSFTGLDVVPVAGDLQRQGIDWRFVQHDLRKLPLPFDDDEFDIVVMKDLSMVVPLGAPSQRVLDESTRILKSGGTLEIWETDHIIRSILPHPPPPPGKNPQEYACAVSTGTFLISPITPFTEVQNKYLQDSNMWIQEALDRRKLSPTPCARISQILLQETETLYDVENRRVAIPLGELRWEREQAGERNAGKRRGSEAGKLKKGSVNLNSATLTEEQAALRYTALLVVIQMIESLEPLLKEVSGKNQEEWQRWWAWMMTNLLEQKGASSGECFEVGVWWCKKV
ncbi:SAM binding motif-containing protein [Setomelanomma holmii]|uniref:SAM binding motif-containing protein n=1 Tax=Setomelanomma holmii TaxID=210430 RepID=A0A9P4H1L9_9PLEO|nr:SAM binding motif-containing protein [Setomelanomma holmii]